MIKDEIVPKLYVIILSFLLSSSIFAGVRPRNGAFYTSFYDFKFSSPTAFTFTRSYSSNINTIGWLGRGWVTPLETRLSTGNNSLTLRHYGGGKNEVFKKSDKNIFKSPLGNTITKSKKGYKLKLKNRHYSFDKNGRLVSYVHNSSSVLLEYKVASFRPKAIRSLGLESAQFRWEQKKIKSIQLNNKTKIQFKYLAQNLKQVKKGKQIWSYDYDTSNNLTSITYPDGSIKTIQYKNNKVTKIVHPGGKNIEYAYKKRGKKFYVTETTTNVSGKKTIRKHEYHYKTISHKNVVAYVGPDGTNYQIDPVTENVVKKVKLSESQFFYNEMGWPKKAKTATGEYDFSYNKAGKLTKVTNGASYIQYDYNKHKLLTKIQSNQYLIQISYNSNNRFATIHYQDKMNKLNKKLNIAYKKGGLIKTLNIAGKGTIKPQYNKDKKPLRVKRSEKESSVQKDISFILSEIKRLSEPLGIKFDVIKI
jgi:YD repeat-containing protein